MVWTSCPVVSLGWEWKQNVELKALRSFERSWKCCSLVRFGSLLVIFYCHISFLVASSRHVPEKRSKHSWDCISGRLDRRRLVENQKNNFLALPCFTCLSTRPGNASMIHDASVLFHVFVAICCAFGFVEPAWKYGWKMALPPTHIHKPTSTYTIIIWFDVFWTTTDQVG